MCEHGPEHPPHHTPQHWFPQYEYVSGYHGYIHPLTIEEELEILEKWNMMVEKCNAIVDKKLARIVDMIGKSQKEAQRWIVVFVKRSFFYFRRF